MVAYHDQEEIIQSEFFASHRACSPDRELELTRAVPLAPSCSSLREFSSPLPHPLDPKLGNLSDLHLRLSFFSLELLLQKSTLFVPSLRFLSLSSSSLSPPILTSSLPFLSPLAPGPNHRHLQIHLRDFAFDRQLASRRGGKRNRISDRLLSAGHRAYGLSRY